MHRPPSLSKDAGLSTFIAAVKGASLTKCDAAVKLVRGTKCVLAHAERYIRVRELSKEVPQPSTSSIFRTPAPFMPSFFDRQGTQTFQEPVEGTKWGYLPQVNEWARGAIEWRCERAGGAEHMPLWEAYPVCKCSHFLQLLPYDLYHTGRDEELTVFTASGANKQIAKEASAKLMALSGHCVSADLSFPPLFDLISS